jgi:hypothetical protein
MPPPLPARRALQLQATKEHRHAAAAAQTGGDLQLPLRPPGWHLQQVPLAVGRQAAAGARPLLVSGCQAWASTAVGAAARRQHGRQLMRRLHQLQPLLLLLLAVVAAAGHLLHARPHPRGCSRWLLQQLAGPLQSATLAAARAAAAVGHPLAATARHSTPPCSSPLRAASRRNPTCHAWQLQRTLLLLLPLTRPALPLLRPRLRRTWSQQPQPAVQRS